MNMMLETLPRRSATLRVPDPPSKVALVRGLADSLPTASDANLSSVPPSPGRPYKLRRKTLHSCLRRGEPVFHVPDGSKSPTTSTSVRLSRGSDARSCFVHDVYRDLRGKRWGPSGENVTTRSPVAWPYVGHAIPRLSRKTANCRVLSSVKQHHHVRFHEWGPSGEGMGTSRGRDGDLLGTAWAPTGEGRGTTSGQDGDLQGWG